MPAGRTFSNQTPFSSHESSCPPRNKAGDRSPWRMVAGSVLALVGLLTLPILLWGASPLSINLSESLPVGLYWTRPLSQTGSDSAPLPSGDSGAGLALEVGMLVSACLPPEVARSALKRGYLPEGSCPSGAAPVGKTVAALPGDTVGVTDSGSFVNGALLPNSTPLLRDSRGRSMPLLRGRLVLPAGTAWLYSGHSPRSFDSRYYGPVSLSNLRGQLFPLLTRGEIHLPSLSTLRDTSSGIPPQGYLLRDTSSRTCRSPRRGHSRCGRAVSDSTAWTGIAQFISDRCFSHRSDTDGA